MNNLKAKCEGAKWNATDCDVHDRNKETTKWNWNGPNCAVCV